MTLAELMTAVRRKLDDAVGKTAVDEDTLVEALNFAQNEFARDTLCIFEDAQFPYVGSTAGLALGADHIWTVYAGIGGTPLTLVTHSQLDNGYFDLNGTEDAARFTAWRAATGTPAYAVTDLMVNGLYLVPEPVGAGSVDVQRYKLPTLMDLEAAPDVEAEIPTVYHDGLVYGALAYLFDIPDLEIYDVNRAALYMAKWSRIVAAAQIALQTATRAPDRALTLPRDRFFAQHGGNTLGTSPSSNTEAAQ